MKILARTIFIVDYARVKVAVYRFGYSFGLFIILLTFRVNKQAEKHNRARLACENLSLP